MISLIDDFIQNSKLDFKNEEFRFSENEKREVFSLLKEKISSVIQNKINNIINITGLRGTGKTHLTLQTAEFFCKKYNGTAYYFDCENLILLDIEPSDIIKKLSNLYKNKSVLVIFDDIQEYEDSFFKKLTEFSNNFVVLTSGIFNNNSSVKKENKIGLTPLSFSEYLLLKYGIKYKDDSLKYEIKEILFKSTDSMKVFDYFLRNKERVSYKIKQISSETGLSIYENINNYMNFYTLPYFLTGKPQKIYGKAAELTDRILYKDIPKICTEQDCFPGMYKKLLFKLAASDETNLESLSSSVCVKQDKIINMINNLSSAGMINILKPYKKNEENQKKFKILFSSPTIRAGFVKLLYGSTEKIIGNLVEDIAVIYLKKHFENEMNISFIAKQGVKADFCLEDEGIPIIIEVGSKKTSGKQIRHSEIKYKYGIVISMKSSDIYIEGKIIYVPMSWFLLT